MNGRTPSPSARQRGTSRLPFCSAAADFFVSRGMVFALGIFAAVGFAVLDDYGVSRDEPVQREIGHAQYVLRGPAIWKASIEPSSNGAATDVYREMDRRTVSREPVIEADFSVHLDRNRLIWRREPCRPEDTLGSFFLHVVPKDVNDLPEDRRRHGFDDLDFYFYTRGAIFDGKCLAAVSLPDYAIAAFRTGQSVGDGPIWEGEYAWPE